MAWTHYASTDAGAPVLTGTADSLNNLKKICLVDGYGTQPAAGWTSPYYDATSKTRVFQNAQGFCLQVVDNGPGTGSTREARVRGYESMTAYNVGAGPFPTLTQYANGLYSRKSATTDTTARAWDIYADNSFFILLVETGDTVNNAVPAMFGRFAPDKLNDSWCQIIAFRTQENMPGTSSNDMLHIRVANIGTVSNGTLVARNVDGSQAVGSTVVGLRSDTCIVSNSLSGAGGIDYPDRATGGLRLDRVFVHEINTPRGYIRGLWQPLHNRPLAHRALETYIDGAVTRTLRAINTATSGQILVEESNTIDL